jgi:hypothetical protein
MRETPAGMADLEGVVLTVLMHGIGLEFKDKERLREFFQKTRELYPDSVLLTETIFVSGDHVITEWTLQAYLDGAFLRRARAKASSLAAGELHRSDRQRQDYRLGGLLRRADVPAQALALHFKEWVEL